MPKKALIATFLLVIASVATLLIVMGSGQEKSGPDTVVAAAQGKPGEAGQGQRPELSVPAPVSASTPAVKSDERATREYFASSLQGTEIDGQFQADDEGNLIVARSTRDLFDYFLSTFGEKSLEEITARIQQEAEATLPPEAAVQAVALLNDYVAYKTAMQEFMQQDMTAEQNQNYLETSEAIHREMADMRRRFFSPEDAEALFGVEEAYGDYALERMRLAADDSLSDEEKAQRYAEMEAEAPADIRGLKERTTGLVLMEQKIADMRAAGASTFEIQQYREQSVGEAEAQRLAKIDAENADWQQRYARYSKQRTAVLASEGLSEVDREAALEDLRQTYFTGVELERARMNDRIEAQSATN